MKSEGAKQAPPPGQSLIPQKTNETELMMRWCSEGGKAMKVAGEDLSDSNFSTRATSSPARPLAVAKDAAASWWPREELQRGARPQTEGPIKQN